MILINSHPWPSVPKAGDLRPPLGFLLLLSRRQALLHVARPGRIWSQQGWGRVPASGSTASPARKAWSCSLTWDHPWEGHRILPEFYMAYLTKVRRAGSPVLFTEPLRDWPYFIIIAFIILIQGITSVFNILNTYLEAAMRHKNTKPTKSWLLVCALGGSDGLETGHPWSWAGPQVTRLPPLATTDSGQVVVF